MPYPEHFLRGIINDEFLVQGLPAGNLFPFQPKRPPRDDDNKECSICWRDQNEAVELLLREKSDKKKDEPKYKVGIGVFSTKELDRMKRKSHCLGRLKYERDELPDNPYHGNLLIDPTVDKKLCNEISSFIALNCYVDILKQTPDIKGGKVKLIINNYLLIPIRKLCARSFNYNKKDKLN